VQLDSVQAHLGRLLKTSDSKTIYTILMLTAIFFVLLALVILT
jgi:hypothetical protein